MRMTAMSVHHDVPVWVARSVINASNANDPTAPIAQNYDPVGATRKEKAATTQRCSLSPALDLLPQDLEREPLFLSSVEFGLSLCDG